MVAGAASGREFWDDNLKCWRPVGDRRRRRQRRRCSSSSFVGGYGTAATAPCISDKFDEFDCEFETERGYAPLHRVANWTPDEWEDIAEEFMSTALRDIGIEDRASEVLERMEARFGRQQLGWMAENSHDELMDALRQEIRNWKELKELSEELLRKPSPVGGLGASMATDASTHEADGGGFSECSSIEPEKDASQWSEPTSSGRSAGAMGRGKGKGSDHHRSTSSSQEALDMTRVDGLEERISLLEKVFVLVDFEKLLSAADKAAERTADLDPCLKALPLTQTAAPCVYDLAMDDEVYDGFYQFTGENPVKAKRSGARRRRRRTRGRSPRPPE